MKESIKKKAGSLKTIIIVISLILALLVVAVLVKSCITYYMQEKAAGVQFLQDEPSKSIVEADPSLIPDYSGKDVIELKGNIPCFTIYDPSECALGVLSAVRLMNEDASITFEAALPASTTAANSNKFLTNVSKGNIKKIVAAAKEVVKYDS